MMFKSVKTGLLAVILLGATMIANAQKKINSGTVTYGIEYSLPPEQAAMASQLPKEQKIKFDNNILRLDMQQGAAQIGILQNFVDKVGLMLIDVPIIQKQYAVKISKEEIEQTEAAVPKLSDFKATGDKQTIAGYNTEKYTYKDDKGSTYELWATTDIELPTGFSGAQFKDIKGALVKYTTFQNGTKVTLTIKNLSEGKVGPLTLEIPKTYEVKTMQEIMAMMQGGGE
ncbi:DUF4412 domain-containing protein [Pedobacter sp. ASV28]|uniref:DUF4412 domain-containing protein n=1 Tax=Pedobacter sp. ASV28 TaxID=2795123 RepID=UPI001E6438DE|nr:DUF4412 domain-containing protein [Pedobacter sp. ASV28]